MAKLTYPKIQDNLDPGIGRGFKNKIAAVLDTLAGADIKPPNTFLSDSEELLLTWSLGARGEIVVTVYPKGSVNLTLNAPMSSSGKWGEFFDELFEALSSL